MFIRNNTLRLLLSLMLVLCMTITAHAEESNLEEQKLPESCNFATVTDDKGNVFLLPVTPVDLNQTNALSSTSDEIFITYRCAIPASIMATGGSQTEYGNDGAYASTVYLTLHYLHNNASPVEYLLKKVTGHWNVTSQSVNVTSSTLDYACHAPNVAPNTAVYNYAVSNNFTKYTGYTYYAPATTFAAIGATLNLEYSMGSSRTWTFSLQNNIYPR
jgi:hypothetical protein